MAASTSLVVQASEPFGDGLTAPSKNPGSTAAPRRWRTLGHPLTLVVILVTAGLVSVGLRLEGDLCWKGRAAQCERSCAEGSPGSCNVLGVMADQGDGLPVDPRRAVALYQRACAAGHVTGCGNLALSARWGEGMDVDLERAAALFARACHSDPRDEARSCNELGLMHDAGIGVPQDDAKAASLYQLACRHGCGVACDNRRQMIENGEISVVR